MKNTRSLRLALVRRMFGAALLASPALATTPEEIASLRSSAESGNPIAQYNLGLAYADKQDPIANLPEAYAWLSLAADNGATGAALMQLSTQMTFEQQADGKRRLELLKNKFASAKKSAAATPAPGAVSISPIAATVAPTEAASQNELKKIGAELAAAWKENDQLKASLSRAGVSTATIDALKNERDQLAASLDATTREAAILRAAAANFEGERNGLLQKISTAAGANGDVTLRTELAAVSEKLKTAEVQLAQSSRASGELDGARRSVATLTEQVQKSSEENQRLSGIIAAGTAETAALSAKLKSAEGELARATATRTDAIDPQEFKRLNGQLSDAKDRLSAAQEGLAKSNAESLRLKEEVVRIRAGAAPAQPQSGEIDALRKALAAATGDRDQLAAQLAQARAGAADSGRAAAELAQLRTQLQAREDALISARNDHDALAQKLSALESSAAAPAAVAAGGDPVELRRQLDETQAKLDTSLRSFLLKEEEIERLQKTLAIADGERASQSARIRTSTAEASDAIARASINNEAAAQLSAVRDQLRQTQNQVASLATENAQLKNRFSLVGASPTSTLLAPRRPGTAAAQQISAQRAVEPAVPTPTPAPERRMHTVVEGETLSRIAKHYYGNSERWAEILEANRATIPDPRAISIGTKLIIP